MKKLRASWMLAMFIQTKQTQSSKNVIRIRGCSSVLDILEPAVIDLELKAAVRAHTEQVLKLM